MDINEGKDIESPELPKETSETQTSPEIIRAMQGGDSNEGQDWVDRGIIDVPVADLPAPEGVSGPQDFDHHISWADAHSAAKRLPEIQAEMRNGSTADDFSADDQQNGLDYSQGKRGVYDLFYGSDPVAVDKIGDEYIINAGRHRIYAAKAVGLESIPARVMEKVR